MSQTFEQWWSENLLILQTMEPRERLRFAWDAALASHAPSDKNAEGLIWAAGRWNLEVRDRPLVNVNRRPLDDTWRQVIRYFGGDPDAILGPNHDTLLANAPSEAAAQPREYPEDMDQMMGSQRWRYKEK